MSSSSTLLVQQQQRQQRRASCIAAASAALSGLQTLLYTARAAVRAGGTDPNLDKVRDMTLGARAYAGGHAFEFVLYILLTSLNKH